MYIAIFHLSIKIISRANAKSAVAAAAYRAAEKFTNDYDGQTHDFTKKSGVVHTEIILPEHAPRKFLDRSTLWNEVEKIEKNKKAQLAREVEIALPKELTQRENIQLTKEYVQRNFVDKGMCADVCFHDTGGGNPHVHIMLTMRALKENGEWDSKQRKEYQLDKNGEKIYDKKKRTYKCKSVPTTDWNEQSKAEEWRQAWADEVNAFLLQKNIDERINNRSYERQGVDTIPTIHMGTASWQMEQNGIRTEKGDINRQIKEENLAIRILKHGISLFKNKIAETFSRKAEIEKAIANSPPSENLVTKLMRFHENGGKFNETAAPFLRNLKEINSFKNVATAIAFLQSAKINTAEELTAKLSLFRSEYSRIDEVISDKTNRISELDKLLETYQVYKLQSPILKEYQAITKEKKRQNFYSRNSDIIKNCEKVRKRLPEKLTPKAWTKQCNDLQNELASERGKFFLLQDNIALAETIVRNMDSLDRYEKFQEREFSRNPRTSKNKSREEESL